MSTSSVHPSAGTASATARDTDLLGQRLRGQGGDPHGRLQRLLSGQWRARSYPSFRVLEAGCGSRSRLQFPEHAHLTGIDISERQLARNDALDTKVQGDLQTHAWPPNSFDLIMCWDVIEHLPHPDRALSRLLDSLAPHGTLVLAYPHLWSLKGLVTKCQVPHDS